MVRLRAGESFPTREDPTAPRPVQLRMAVAARRPRVGSLNKSGGSGSSRAAMLPLPPPPPASPSASRVWPEGAAAEGVRVEDTDALDCGVCFLTLKAPIFQCNAGHVVCSLCRDKLQASGKSHVCGIATSGYNRCHAMERLVESISFPCPNAVYGCSARLAYHNLRNHCHCPSEACNFVGSTKALSDHFRVVHNWPYTAINMRVGDCVPLSIPLYDGFNFLLTDGVGDSQGVKDIDQCLFLLNVVRQPLGHAICVFRVHSHAAPGDDQGPCLTEMKFKLTYSRGSNNHGRNADKFDYYQRSTFKVGCTDFSNGLPSIDTCVQFVVLD